MNANVTTLPPEPASVPAARRFVRAALLEHGAQGALDDAETLVSELATNAVLHARTAFRLEVLRVGASVRIRVADGSVVLPQQRSYGRQSTTGRGMRLVASMALAWGVESTDDGKVVWFDLAVAGRPGTVRTWDEEKVDVDALLLAYGDGEGGPPPVVARVA